jgi:hypothetical protein
MGQDASPPVPTPFPDARGRPIRIRAAAASAVGRTAVPLGWLGNDEDE